MGYLAKHTIVVAGKGAFPVELLWAQRAIPTTEADAKLILASFTRLPALMSISLDILVPNGLPSPVSEYLWKDRGWPIQGHNVTVRVATTYYTVPVKHLMARLMDKEIAKAKAEKFGFSNATLPKGE